MCKVKMRRVLAVWLALLVFAVSAAIARDCAVCGEPIKIEFVWLTSPSFVEKRAVCVPCSKIDTLCFVCSLAVKVNYKNLGDGRLIYAEDDAVGPVSATDAECSFREVKR